jgi:hypothetical protein
MTEFLFKLQLVFEFDDATQELWPVSKGKVARPDYIVDDCRRELNITISTTDLWLDVIF